MYLFYINYLCRVKGEISPYRVQASKLKRRVRMVAVTTNPIDVVNKTTGEVMTATPYVGNRAWRDVSDFVKVFKPREIGMLSEREFKVFCWAMGRLDFEGRFKFNGAECKEAMGFKSERSVYYGLKGLVEKDYVKKDKRGMYWVNPNIAYRGNRDELLDL